METRPTTPFRSTSVTAQCPASWIETILWFSGGDDGTFSGGYGIFHAPFTLEKNAGISTFRGEFDIGKNPVLHKIRDTLDQRDDYRKSQQSNGSS